jgi:single-strand DNA-binding protein
MNFTVKGTIIEIEDIQIFESGAKKLTLVIDTKEQYNNEYALDYFKSGEYVKYVDEFAKYNKIGDQVEVEFNFNQKKYNGRYYTNLNLWKITKIGAGNPEDKKESIEEDDENLPF